MYIFKRRRCIRRVEGSGEGMGAGTRGGGGSGPPFLEIQKYRSPVKKFLNLRKWNIVKNNSVI